jgi:hypothetical protein
MQRCYKYNKRGSGVFYGSASRLCKYYRTEPIRRQAEVILNHENPNVRAIGKGEPRHRKYKRLKLGGRQAYDRSSV